MPFVFYNPNPAGKRVIDCTVRMITIVLDVDWHTAYRIIAQRGDEMCDMPSSNSVWGSVLRDHGFKRYPIDNTCPDCYTVKDFCIDHPIGLFVLATSGHVLAVVDGKYYDTLDSGYEIPIYYWKKETK